MVSVKSDKWKSFVGTKRFNPESFIASHHTQYYVLDVTFEAGETYVTGGVPVNVLAGEAKKVLWAFADDGKYQYVDGKMQMYGEKTITIAQTGEDIVVRVFRELDVGDSLDGKSVSLLVFAGR